MTIYENRTTGYNFVLGKTLPPAFHSPNHFATVIFFAFFLKSFIFGLVVVFCMGICSLVIHYPGDGICIFPLITNFAYCKATPIQFGNETCQEQHKRLVQEVKLQKPTGPDNSRFFKTITNLQDQEILRDLLEKLVQVATKHNILYFMYAGTLIGSYRHHGLIPWDDDIDFLIPAAQRNYVSKLLSNLGPKYKIIYQEELVSKFCLTSSTPVQGYTWTYPYIDLYFYKEDRYSIHFLGKIDKSLVFPLGKRPFWNFTLPSPKNTEGLIRLNAKTFDTDCLSQPITHRDAKSVNVWTEKCHNLWDMFPFVFRCKTTSGKGVNETLWIGDQLISWNVII